MHVVVREATDGDAGALASLSTQLGYPADAATMRDRLQRVTSQRIGCVFVAESNGNILGWTHVVERIQLEDPPFAEIAGLIVDEQSRGARVGASLLRAAETWASDRGYERMRVRSNVIRERAHRFYDREGYIQLKRQIVFEKPLSK